MWAPDNEWGSQLWLRHAPRSSCFNMISDLCIRVMTYFLDGSNSSPTSAHMDQTCLMLRLIGIQTRDRFDGGYPWSSPQIINSISTHICCMEPLLPTLHPSWPLLSPPLFCQRAPKMADGWGRRRRRRRRENWEGNGSVAAPLPPRRADICTLN